MNEQSRPALARGVRLQTEPATGEPMLLFPEGVLYLSETANEIVCRCDGSNSIAEILAALAEEYQAEPETLRQDVLDCLHDLYQRKLVVV
ncbi:MAG TPA: pyrroloquinoline quinone biosynthesis peptide chaperone PqqD [Verrucomicrobiae bacterium]|nr:pyrroloquinoline quinone biosynthesis peptide chaperone PqqD [Verrucomicrobiae bacterium]